MRYPRQEPPGPGLISDLLAAIVAYIFRHMAIVNYPSTELGPAEMVVRAYWRGRVQSEELTPGTASRYERVFESFVRYVRARGRTSTSGIDRRLCLEFIWAPMAGRKVPSPSTSRFRLTVLRDAFNGLAVAIGSSFDPTVGLTVVQSVQEHRPAPLTPLEVRRLRSAGRLSPRDQVRPSTVELALCGGNHVEIARAVVADVDLREEWVLIGGRRAELDPFAVSTFRARLSACRGAARRRRSWVPMTEPLALHRPLDAYPPTSIAPTISSNLSRALASAGILRPDVRPRSVREYGANRVYAVTDRVESVADFLGFSSLDAARGFIDPQWQADHAEEVRGRDGS